MSIIRPLDMNERDAYNAVVKHPLQTWEWGEFRRKTGIDVERFGVFENGKMTDGFQVFFHPLPKVPFTAGYFPKSKMLHEQELQVLHELGKKKKALFIKMEPDVSFPVTAQNELEEKRRFLAQHGAVPGRPLFTRYSFFLDISPNEETLLANMRPKTRYNIHVAERKGVTIVEDSTNEGLQEYLTVLHETTKRQQFYAHSDFYFQTMWELLKEKGMMRLLKATYQGKTLVTWIVFVHNGVLYYPYGASSSEHREVMASNLMMWEAIQLGKRLGCTSFDMWGSLGPDPDPKDPWYGFHRFKEGYGATLMEFVGSFDLVINPQLYGIFRFLENLRWKWLRARARVM